MGGLAGRVARLTLVLYASTLVVGLAPAAVATAGVWRMAGASPWRSDLLGAGWLDLLVELPPDPAGAGLVSLGMLLGAVAMLAQGVVYSFLAGGVLTSLSKGAGRPLARGSFLAACRRWFLPNLQLSIVGGIVQVTISLVGGSFAVASADVVRLDLALILVAVVQALAWGWLEVARAALVLAGGRDVSRALSYALERGRRPVTLVVWLLLAVPTTLVLVAAGLPPAPGDTASPAALLAAVVYGQAVAVAGALTKVIRLGVALRLARAGVAP